MCMYIYTCVCGRIGEKKIEVMYFHDYYFTSRYTRLRTKESITVSNGRRRRINKICFYRMEKISSFFEYFR